jgi:hypothetical protein
MNSPNKQERFEWLDAGRALGDLSPEEEAEWKPLAEVVSEEDGSDELSEFSLDAIVATLEQGLSPAVSLPEELKDQISAGAKDFHQPADREVTKGEVIVRGDQAEEENENILRPSFWSRPAIGWAAAAVLALLLIVQSRPDGGGGADAPSLVEQVERDPDLLRRPFAGTGEEADPVGEVLWSDTQKQGVMLLGGLPENDPTVSQYQLWIVDPARDDVHPVDGGVFDIPASTSGPVVVPIAATLPIVDPAAFVITVEQPGGVVVSKQEQVVAIAKS